MAATLESIKAFLEEHRELIMNKTKLRHHKKQGWEEVKNEILKKLYFSKLKVQSLRQFIPQTDEQKIEEANRYLQKNLFCE